MELPNIIPEGDSKRCLDVIVSKGKQESWKIVQFDPRHSVVGNVFERCLFNWILREANVAANELGARAYSFSQLLFSGLLFLKPRIVLFCKSRILSSMKLIFVQKIIIIKCIERLISD